MRGWHQQEKKTNQRLKILLIAYGLKKDVTVEELAVESWKFHPDEFGMKTYDLPDVTRVYSKLYGAGGIIASGLMENDGIVLRLTKRGLEMAEKAAKEIDRLAAQQAKLAKKSKPITSSIITPPVAVSMPADGEAVTPNAAYTIVAAVRTEVDHAKRKTKLESTSERHAADAASERRDASGGMANTDQAVGQIAQRDGGAPKHVRNDAVVFSQRIEAGWPVAWKEREGDGRESSGRESSGSGGSGGGGGGEGNGESSRNSADNDASRSRVEAPTRDMDTSAVESREVTEILLPKSPVKNLPKCFYCGAGTAPAFLDDEERPMCGGCHRDLGTGKKVPAHARKRVAAMLQTNDQELALTLVSALTGSDLHIPMDHVPVAQNLPEPKRKRKRAAKEPRLAKVIDLPIAVPSAYIARKFKRSPLGGHSSECMEATHAGCIAGCPIRVSWEADGRPER